MLLDQESANSNLRTKSLALPLFCKIKFYWHTAMPIHVLIVYGSFPHKMAELSSFHRDPLAYKTKIIDSLALCSQNIPTPGLDTPFQVCPTQDTPSVS